MKRTSILVGAGLALLAACVTDDDDSAPVDDDDDAGAGATLVEGRVFDEDTTAAVADCEVGVTRSQAVRTTREGRFSITVDRGSVFNVRCEGAIVRSFQLPDVDAVDWEINVDFWGAPPADEDCFLNVTADLTALGIEAGDGTAEVVVLGADGVGRPFRREAASEITYLGFLTAPLGPVRVLTRAYGGSVAGFGASDLATCAGGGGEVDVENLVADVAAVVDREGTWVSPGEGATLEVFGVRQDDEPALTDIDIRLDHTLDAGDTDFTVAVFDGVTDPVLRARACRTGLAGRACVHRLDLGPDDPLAMGLLPEHVIAGARLQSGRITMFTDREVASGAVTGLLIDATDPFDQRPIWKAWSPTGSLDVSTEWLGTVPPVEFLTLIASGEENVTFDFTTDFGAEERGDGWIELRPTGTPVADGG